MNCEIGTMHIYEKGFDFSELTRGKNRLTLGLGAFEALKSKAPGYAGGYLLVRRVSQAVKPHKGPHPMDIDFLL
jgi:hypothetical protein